MVCALNIIVFKQHKTDISIESGILILPVLSNKDYRVSVLYSRPDIYRAFLGYDSQDIKHQPKHKYFNNISNNKNNNVYYMASDEI